MLVNWMEKRRCPRINVKVPVRYQIRGKPEFNNAVSGDISVGGLGFSNDRFIAPNLCLNIEINMLPQIINTTGRVVRADSLPRSDKYRLGVEFLELDYRQKEFLSGYINKRTGD